VSLNKECLACSGQSATILKAFKIACLSYHSSPLMYRDEQFERADLIKLNGKMLNSIWQKLKSGYPWLLKGGDEANNTTVAYDYKQLQEKQHVSIVFENERLKYHDSLHLEEGLLNGERQDQPVVGASAQSSDRPHFDAKQVIGKKFLKNLLSNPTNKHSSALTLPLIKESSHNKETKDQQVLARFEVVNSASDELLAESF